MKKIADILRAKPSSHVHRVTPETTVLEAVALMADSDISAVMVLDGERLAGIVTERDYVRRVAKLERSAYATTVSEVMSAELITVRPEDSTRFCMQLMIEKNLRHLPVVVDGKMLGMLSIRDLVRDVISEQEGLISQLEQYIRGE